MITFIIFIVGAPIFASGRVTIISSYYPAYVQTGHDLVLVCNSSQRYDLQWQWKTESTHQIVEMITPVSGGLFSIKTVNEEPSGHVESTLTKTEMKTLDTGNYICKDKNDESMYTVYVTVLHIVANDVVGEVNDNQMILQCKIIGFTNNLPQMAVTWSFDDKQVSPESGKYAIHFDEQKGVTQLIINNPGREDGGSYGCVFGLSTYFGRTFHASEKVTLNADKLPATISGGKSDLIVSSAFSILPLLISLVSALILL